MRRWSDAGRDTAPLPRRREPRWPLRQTAASAPAPEFSSLSGDLLTLLLAVGAVLLTVALATPRGPTAFTVPTSAAVTLASPLRLFDPAPTPLAQAAPSSASLPGLAAASAALAVARTSVGDVARATTLTTAMPRHATATTPAPATPPAIAQADLSALGAAIAVVHDDATPATALRLRIRSEALFAPAQAELTAAGQAVLQPLADLLRRDNAPVLVEGHADSVPIHNPHYPSNWELSASRAASVLRYLQSHGVAAKRLHTSAYAHTRPVASNNTEAGRAANRRVEIVVPFAPVS